MLCVGMNEDLEFLLRMFSQSEIDMTLDYLLIKLDKDLPREPFIEIAGIDQLIRVLLKISEIYSREVEIARSLWLFKTRLDKIIDSCTQSEVKSY